MKTASLLALLLALAPCARAKGAGADPFNFLFLDANPRPVALGGAYTGLAAGADSLLYNPAGLGVAPMHEATFMHNQHFQGIMHDYAAYASPRGFGLNLNSLRLGDAPRTTYSNPNGNGLGDAGLSALSLGAGYGREVLEGLRLGAAFKFIREDIAGVSAQGYAVDFGAQRDVALLNGLTLGLAVQNVGPAVRFQRDSENLPLNIRTGAAYRFTLLGQENAASFDVTKARSESPLFAFGVETVAAGVLPVRLGFNTRNQAGPGFTFGLGWRHANYAFDYAFTPYGDLGTGHRFGVTARWGAQETAAERAEAAAKRELRDKDTPAARFTAADRAAARGDVEGARRDLEAARRMLPREDRRLVLYLTKSGELTMAEGDVSGAQELFIEAIRTARRLETTGPAVAGAYIGLAECLKSSGNLRASRDALQKALEVDPSDRQLEEIRAGLGKAKR